MSALAPLPVSSKRVQVKAVPKTGRKGTRKLEDVPDRLRQALATPEGFAVGVLGLPGNDQALYPAQGAVLRDLTPEGAKVVWRCGNEVGKTSVGVTTAVLWHLTVFPTGQVISTAGAWRQVTGQLVPNLKKHSHKFPKDWQFNAESVVIKGVPRYIGFSTTNQQRSQGYHGDSLNPLLAIIDEAAAVADDIFFSFEERCNPQRFFVTGSTLDPVGAFYRMSTEQARFYSQHKLSQPECAHISREAIFRTIEKFDPEALAGVDRDKPDWAAIEGRCRHPVVLSRVFGAFYTDVENAVLGLRDLELCLENPPTAKPGDRKAFCDFAAGGDENVLAVRVGNKVWIEKAWRERDTMAGVGEFARLFAKLKREYGFRPCDIEGDADGAGKVMIDRLRELGWPIEEFHGGSKPREDSRYFNRISEVWIEGADKIRKRQVILERDAELMAQLVSRRWHRKSEGSARIEGKEDLFKRKLGSPDRADAVLGAMQPGVLATSTNPLETMEEILASKSEPFEDAHQPGMAIDESVLESIGANAGW